jgi:hypothetical protein
MRFTRRLPIDPEIYFCRIDLKTGPLNGCYRLLCLRNSYGFSTFAKFRWLIIFFG